MSQDDNEPDDFDEVTLDDLDIDLASDPDHYTLPDKSMLTLVREERGWKLFYTPNPEHAVASMFGRAAKTSSPPILLVEADEDRKMLVTYPLNTAFGHSDYLGPKYEQLKSISLDGVSGRPPDHIGKLLDFIRHMPAGVVKDPQFGLGLHKELNYIVEAIERIDGVTDLCIAEHSAEVPWVEGHSFNMTHDEFQDSRKALLRAHRKALAIAADEKRVFLHNTFLTKFDSERFPLQHRKYRKDALQDAIGDSLAAKPRLSSADQDTLIRAVKITAGALAQSRPEAVMELSREIEVVTLRQLIDRMKGLVGKGGLEASWQAFFIENPFALWLAFGFPVTVIGQSVAVGGLKLDRSGMKIADFAMKALATGNITLVEIKTPDAKLLDAKAYRGEVFAPARELAGAVNQVLDQRYQLQREINSLKANSDRNDIETYAVQCLVIAGRVPEEKAQRKSLELFRHSLHGVQVVTYDELLRKLEQLLEFLQPGAAETPNADDAVVSSGADVTLDSTSDPDADQKDESDG